MQLRQFLWIFLRCAHVTVNGMNRNVRTVCSILWNCYDFFFSYHIIYLPGNFCKFSGQFISFGQYLWFNNFLQKDYSASAAVSSVVSAAASSVCASSALSSAASASVSSAAESSAAPRESIAAFV